MSLKDRLNNQNKDINTQAQPKYYESDIEAQKADSLGPIDSLLTDEDINAIYVNGPKNVYIEKRGKVHKSTITYRDVIQLENIIKRNAQALDIDFNEKNPFVKFNLKEGINVSATLPPLSKNITMQIKCYNDKHATLQNLQQDQALSKEIALVLDSICAHDCNIIIAGEQNTLKTTLLSALSKRLPKNDRGIAIDSKNEITNNNNNFCIYDFSTIKDKNIENELIKSILHSKTEKIFLNDCEDILCNFTQEVFSGYKGLNLTIQANNRIEAIRKIALNYHKTFSCFSLNEIEKRIFRHFDIMIFTTRDEAGRRKIQSISQLTLDESENTKIEDIFLLDNKNEHNSCDFIPNFYKSSDDNLVSINTHIFDSNYKHTYYQNHKNDALAQFAKRTTGSDILKKFKKELPAQNIQDEINAEEVMKKVQEKFEELRKNAQVQEIKHIETEENSIQNFTQNQEILNEYQE